MFIVWFQIAFNSTVNVLKSSDNSITVFNTRLGSKGRRGTGIYFYILSYGWVQDGQPGFNLGRDDGVSLFSTISILACMSKCLSWE
jgi:hypothetical protein